MGKRVVMLSMLWLVGATFAAAGVASVLSVLGTGLFGSTGHPISQTQVKRELAQVDHSVAAQPSPSPSPSVSLGRPLRITGTNVQPTVGGTVLASCAGGLVRITSSPAQGYAANNLVPGPAPTRPRHAAAAGAAVRRPPARPPAHRPARPP